MLAFFHISADISYFTWYQCSCPLHSFAPRLGSYLLRRSFYFSNHRLCHLCLYSQLPCGHISYKVGPRKRWGASWNGSGKSLSYNLNSFIMTAFRFHHHQPLFSCPELSMLLSRYQMLYETELKDFSGPSMGVYLRWPCCLPLLFFAYICFAVQLLNRNLLAWEGNKV